MLPIANFDVTCPVTTARSRAEMDVGVGFLTVVCRIACWFIWVLSILKNDLEHDRWFPRARLPPFVAIVVGSGYAFVMRQWAHDRRRFGPALLSSASEIAFAPWRRIVPWCIPPLRCP